HSLSRLEIPRRFAERGNLRPDRDAIREGLATRFIVGRARPRLSPVRTEMRVIHPRNVASRIEKPIGSRHMCPSPSRTPMAGIPRVVTRSSEDPACPDPVFSTRAVGSVVLSAARYEPGFQGDVHRHPVPYFVYVVEGGFTESCSNGCVPYGRGSVHFHPSD